MAALEISSQSDQQHSPSGSASSGVNKRKRRPAGTPDPDAEVVYLSPKTLMESDRYICEICNQGFQRDQNLQMHRRRHKVPWKLLKRDTPEVKKRVYVCPEPTCLHHDPCHALGDLVGIKKHYRRKHSTEKQWKCDKCSKGYAVQSDYKAHLKTCGTRGHCCACGRVFSRVESFIEHQDTCSVARERAMEAEVSSGLSFLKQTSSNMTLQNSYTCTVPERNKYMPNPQLTDQRELQLMPMMVKHQKPGEGTELTRNRNMNNPPPYKDGTEHKLQLTIGLPVREPEIVTDLQLSSPCSGTSGEVSTQEKQQIAMLRYMQECSYRSSQRNKEQPSLPHREQYMCWNPQVFSSSCSRFPSNMFAGCLPDVLGPKTELRLGRDPEQVTTTRFNRPSYSQSGTCTTSSGGEESSSLVEAPARD